MLPKEQIIKMFGNYFYHSQFRNLISAFGSIFNQLLYVRPDAKIPMHVPIRYGPADIAYMMKKDGGKFDNSSLSEKFIRTFPKMLFEMGDPTIDVSRQGNLYGQCDGDYGKVDTPVPYSVPFTLTIATKNQTDAFQIIEQILPIFKKRVDLSIPSFVRDGSREIFPIFLEGSSKTDNYDESGVGRIVIYELLFKVNFALYGAIGSNYEDEIFNYIEEHGDPRPESVCCVTRSPQQIANDDTILKVIIDIFDDDFGFNDSNYTDERIEIEPDPRYATSHTEVTKYDTTITTDPEPRLEDK